MRAKWLEGIVWDDVRRFLENPGEVLERAREQAAESPETGELSERREELARRLSQKHKERDRWLHLYAQGHISDEELETHLTELRAQLDNLKLLLEFVEGDLDAERERAVVAETAEAWLLALRERIDEIEEDTEEALPNAPQARPAPRREDRRGPRQRS